MDECNLIVFHNSLAHICAGCVAFVFNAKAILQWVVHLRLLGAQAELEANKMAEESGKTQVLNKHEEQPCEIIDIWGDNRTEMFMDFVRTVLEGIMLRELIISAPYLFIEPADSYFELSTFSLLCRLCNGFAPCIYWFVVTFLRNAYGEEPFFDMWIGMMQRPLDMFEKIHIGGKQIASMFYYTS